MKNKVLNFTGLALFIGAIIFNVQINLGDNLKMDDITLKNMIMASTESLEPLNCSELCADIDSDCNLMGKDANGNIITISCPDYSHKTE